MYNFQQISKYKRFQLVLLILGYHLYMHPLFVALSSAIQKDYEHLAIPGLGSALARLH